MARLTPSRGATLLGLTIAAGYCAALGVFSVAWRPNGVDFAIFHGAGQIVRVGVNPYLAGTLPLPFAYPPNWIPFCVVLSLLPWPLALAAWKVANLLFLAGVVGLSRRLFPVAPLSPKRQSRVWMFSLVLWPTISTFFTGNTPLLVLFFTCATLLLIQRGRETLAGLCLAVALSKPPLLLPLLALLAYQRRFLVLLVAAVATGLLWMLGMYLAGTTAHDYFVAVAYYATQNAAADPSVMGLPNLLAIVAGASSAGARQIALALGVVSVALVVALQHLKGGGRRAPARCLPLVLLLGPAFFGARTYDLVFVIPAFVWCMSLLDTRPRVATPAIALMALFFVPQPVVQLCYKGLLAPVIPESLFAIGLTPFRSWALMALVALSALLTFGERRTRWVALAAPTGIGASAR